MADSTEEKNRRRKRQKRTTEDLIHDLFVTIDMLQSGDMDYQEGLAVAAVSGRIIETIDRNIQVAKLELIAKEKNTNFNIKPLAITDQTKDTTK